MKQEAIERHRHAGGSIADRLVATAGRPSGFDYMRIILSVGIVSMHTVLTSYGETADMMLWASPLGTVLRTVVPMFFVLSGFLVCGSLARCRTMFMFVGLRAIRIYPALIVEVVLSALLLGPLLTTRPLAAYFTDPLFFRYLVNVTGHISYFLPGVFESNPLPRVVNAQLWTVPYELYAYAAFVAVALLNVRKRPWIIAAGIVVVAAVHLLARLYIHGGHYERPLGGTPAPLLIGYAYAGGAAYLYRERIPYNGWLALLAATCTVVPLSGLDYGEYLAIPGLSYLTIWLGLLDLRRSFVVRTADYSYGVFLYGFAVQQACVALWPALRVWWINLLVTLPLVLAFAALSWHWIEKPALGLKPLLKAAEIRWLGFHEWCRRGLRRRPALRRPPARAD